ncbi:hypothetical protein AHAS_Ahas18G0173100 [Arachis hypogaea]
MNGSITHLENNNGNSKLAEIEAIGFGFVKRIPYWPMKQSIVVQLAKAYDVDSNTLQVDVGNIRINAELIGKALGISSGGKLPLFLSYPLLDMLDRTRVWVTAWTAAELEKKATNVLSQDCIRDKAEMAKEPKREANKTCSQTASKEASPQRERKITTAHKEIKKGAMRSWSRNTSEQPPSSPFQPKLPEDNTAAQNSNPLDVQFTLYVDGYCDTYVDVHLSTKRKEKVVVATNSDDEDNEPIAKRICRLFQQDGKPHNKIPTHGEDSGKEQNTDEKLSEAHDPDPITPSTALVDFDLDLMQCPEIEEILDEIEQGWYARPISMEPIQTVMPKNSHCHTPSLGKRSFSLGLTQLETTPTPFSPSSVHPRLKNVKLEKCNEK